MDFPHRQNCGQIRIATHLPKPFKNPSHSKIIYKAIDATVFWTDLNQQKPSSGRKGDHEVVERACATLKSDETFWQRALPQSPAAPAFGPGRKHALLPALAKNMPPAYFLNASRPPGGSLCKNRLRNRRESILRQLDFEKRYVCDRTDRRHYRFG